MKRLVAGLAAALALIVMSPVSSFAGTTPHFTNCGPGKFVTLHWHNYKAGYVDVYWGATEESAITGSPKYDGTFSIGNHSRNTSRSTIYWGFGSRATQVTDKLWATCGSAT